MRDNAFALMKATDGKVAMSHSSATQWKHKFSLEIFLEDSYVVINGILTSTRSYEDESITFAKNNLKINPWLLAVQGKKTLILTKMTRGPWKMKNPTTAFSAIN